MNDQFETWVKRYFPEQELQRLPSGSYRNTATRLLQDGFNGAREMLKEEMLKLLERGGK